MNHKIRILDQDVANIIAAGEVVENPSAMIKELIENSLDAGAEKIEILIDDGGRYVKITDNGEGMSKGDLLLCVERHATSKIKNKEDIYRLSTYGFRGEALASIASISKMEMSSRNDESLIGYKILLSGGSIYKTEEHAMNRGTCVEVYDLFFNTPARLKFMKSKNTEYSKIKDIVVKEALISYNVSFSLFIEGKKVVSTSGKGPETTIFELFGKEVLKNIIPFEFGFLGNMEILKSSKDFIFTYFNRRYAKSSLVDKAVIEGYYTKLMKDKYPFAVIILDINPQEIDVNIHPSKKSVKFSDERKIYAMVKTAVEKKIANVETDMMPVMKFEAPIMERKVFDFVQNDNIKTTDYVEIAEPQSEPFGNYRTAELPLEKNNEIYETDESGTGIPLKENNVQYSSKFDVETGEILEEASPLLKNQFSIIGQLHNMYILVETKDGLEVYDQHIVHERVLYEKLKERNETTGYMKRPLLVPLRINAGKIEKEIIFENKEILETFGFEVDEFGDEEIIVRSIPEFEFRESISEVFKQLCEEIKENNDIRDIREKIIISMSCKGAIKAGEKLGHFEMNKMIEELHKFGKYTCPHGRPIIIKVPFDELEKKFGRKQ